MWLLSRVVNTASKDAHSGAGGSPSSKSGPSRRRPLMLPCIVLAASALALCGCAQTSEIDSTDGATSARAVVAATPVALHLDVGSYSLESPSATITGTVTPAQRSRSTIIAPRSVGAAGARLFSFA